MTVPLWSNWYDPIQEYRDAGSNPVRGAKQLTVSVNQFQEREMTDGNQSAFAIPHMIVDGHVGGGQDGLTKRELFAAMAMQGALANPEEWPTRCDTTQKIAKECALLSCYLADALIAELNKETTT